MARRNDHTREQLEVLILDAAWSIVAEQGVGALTVRKIARTIGYAPGTVYNVFESMDELMLHINARTLDVLYEVLSLDEIADMESMAAAYMGFARDFAPYWMMLFGAELPEERVDVLWYQEKIDRLFLPLEVMLEGVLRCPQDRRVHARILWSSIHGLCFLQHTGRLASIEKQSGGMVMAREMIRVYLLGLKVSTKTEGISCE